MICYFIITTNHENSSVLTRGLNYTGITICIMNPSLVTRSLLRHGPTLDLQSWVFHPFFHVCERRSVCEGFGRAIGFSATVDYFICVRNGCSYRIMREFRD